MTKKIGQNLKNCYYRMKSTIGLSLSLAKAGFKLKNEGSYLGVLWYLLYPMIMFGVMMFVRGSFYGHQEIADFPVYLMLGLIMFNFFSGNLGFATGDIIRNKGFIKSMKISKWALVISGLLQYSFSHIFELIVLLILMIYAGIPIMGLFFYPLIFILFFIFILGVSLIFSVIGTYVADIGNIWAIMTTIILFITPIGFITKEGTLIHTLNLFNPINYFITFARDVVIYGKIPSLTIIFLCIGSAVFSLLIGCFVFHKYENKLAELV